MSPTEFPASLVVRLRPNMTYLGLLLIAAALVAYGIVMANVFGVIIAACAGVMLVVLGYPVVLSTACRVPVLVADDEGIRLPLMGVRLAWTEVASVKRSLGGRARTPSVPVLLIYPADAEAATGRVRPWLRREARDNIVRYGTPIVLSDRSLDSSLDDITTAIRHHLPQNRPL